MVLSFKLQTLDNSPRLVNEYAHGGEDIFRLQVEQSVCIPAPFRICFEILSCYFFLFPTDARMERLQVL